MQTLSSLLNNYLDKQYFTGAVCLVVKDDELVFDQSLGYTNIDQAQKVTNNTIFDLASLTKIVTSTLILRLISNHKITLKTQLGECLPTHQKELSSITIEQLLTHSSGLVAWHPFYSHLPERDLFNILNTIKIKHGENQKVVYSDLNYILLGKVLERQYSKRLDQVVNQYLSKPLDIGLTYGPINTNNVAATEFGNRTEMKMCKNRGIKFDYWRQTDRPMIGEVNDGNTYYFLNGHSGHAGLFGSAKDLIKINDLYLKGGVYNHEAFLNEELVKQSLENRVGNRGLGWHSGQPFPTGMGHTGFTGTALWVVPKQQLNVVLLTNRLNVKQPKNLQGFREDVFKAIMDEFI